MQEIERLNHFLEKVTFEVPEPYFGSNEYINVKIQITGKRNYIHIGEDMPHLEYTIYLLSSQNPIVTAFLSHIFDEKEEYDITTTRGIDFYSLTNKVNELLRNFLKYFSINDNVICKKIVNHISKPMSESILREDKYDSLVRKIVRDIVNLFKNKEHGNFNLPNDEMFYSFGNLNDFNVELELTPTEQVDGYNIESNFYREDDTMEIQIEYNPKYGPSIIYDLIGDLNDNIRHELQHSIQHSQDYKFPKKEPKSPLKYYTQPHEIEAQKKGFRRVAKLQRKPLEQVVRQWFNKNRNRHGLSDKEIEIVIDQILK
jgi:hypothetical protein